MVAYLWCNPTFSPDDAAAPEIDILTQLKADFPPAIVFFGDQDAWKKVWDAAHHRWLQLGTQSIQLQLAIGQAHTFFNKDPLANPNPTGR